MDGVMPGWYQTPGGVKWWDGQKWLDEAPIPMPDAEEPKPTSRTPAPSPTHQVPAGWFQTLEGPLFWSGEAWTLDTDAQQPSEGASLPGWHKTENGVLWWTGQGTRWRKVAPLPLPPSRESLEISRRDWTPAPSRTLPEAIRVCMMEKYAVGKGRASRSEFWWFVLGANLVAWTLSISSIFFAEMGEEDIAYILFAGWGIWSLTIIIPTFAVAIRRMHDTNNTGAIVLLPLVNLIMAATPGTPGPNKYDE